MGRVAAALLWIILSIVSAHAGASDPADLVAPLSVGDPLEGGYVIRSVEMDEDGTVTVTVSDDEGTVRIRFLHRDETAPAYARTEHCDVIWETEQDQAAQTPESLDRAIRQLVEAARGQDGICARSDGTVRVPGPPPVKRQMRWIALLVTLLGLALLGVVAHCVRGRMDERHVQIAFWLAVGALAVVGAYLGSVDLGAPLCDSGQSTRAELGAGSIYDILTFRIFDHRHPPVTSLMIHVGHWMGGKEWMLRLPFLVVTTATIFPMAHLCRSLSGRVAGVGGAAVLALSEPLLVMPREMKSHALFPLAVILVTMALLRVTGSPTRRNAVILGVVDGLAVWMHYMTPVVLAPQLMALFTKTHRPWAKISLPVAAILSAPPLHRLAINMVRDMQLRSIAARYPEVAWGANTVEGVASSGVHIVGPALLACLVLTALAGSVKVLSGGFRRSRLLGINLVLGAWLLPLSVIVLTPAARMLGVYLRLSIPLLAVLAVTGGSFVAHVVSRPVPSRFMGEVRSSVQWLLVFAAGATAAYQIADGFPRDVYGFDDRCVYPEMAREIAGSEVSDVVLVHGYSASLMGYYLDGSRDVKRIPHQPVKRYGRWTVTWLAGIDDLGPSWKQDAQEKLASITRTRRVWLLDLQTVEGTWPELEGAGRCREVLDYPHARMLMCGP